MPDHLLRAVNRSLAIRIVTAVTRDLCQDAATRHDTTPAVACALGRGLTGGLLLSTVSTTGERVTVQLQGDGPLRGLTLDSYDDGDVRGYPMRPRAWEGRPMTERQRLADLLGRDGVVNVMRDIGLRDRYQGQIRLCTGEIDEDIEAYLRDSEQVPSALGCEVVLDADGRIVGAAGFLAQVMPGGHEELIRQAQHRLRTGALYELAAGTIRGGLRPELIAETILPGIDIEPLDRRALRFRCRCSRERIESMLGTLGATDLGEMIADGQAEITCNFCNERYLVDRDTLLRIREQVAPKEKN